MRKSSNGSNLKETSPTRRKSKRNERQATNASLPRAKEKKRRKRMAAGYESVVSGVNVVAAGEAVASLVRAEEATSIEAAAGAVIAESPIVTKTAKMRMASSKSVSLVNAGDEAIAAEDAVGAEEAATVMEKREAAAVAEAEAKIEAANLIGVVDRSLAKAMGKLDKMKLLQKPSKMKERLRR